MSKKRLDHRVHEKYPHYSRKQLQEFITQGFVTVNGTIITKPGAAINSDAVIVCDIQEPRYVSRAGFKLEKTLEHFHIDITGLVALDAGISTGGFTDCLLQHGAKKIYGIDVGHGQVHEKIAHDERVIVMEKTNLRSFNLHELVDIITLDLSFISVLKVMDVVAGLLKPEGKLIVLIKPQFEAGKADVGNGIIKDPKIHARVIEQVVAGIQVHGFECVGVIDSPIEGGSGNKEFLGYFKKK